jgi:hypothetical protein
MGRPAILRHMESDAATLSGGSWQGTLPLVDLQDRDVAKVARSVNALEASTRFRLDFGTTATRWLSLLLLLGHNITAAGQVRIVLTSDASDVSAGARIYDSGLVAAWDPVAAWGGAPWGSFGWDGLLGGDGPPEVRHRFVVPQIVGLGGARYAWIYLHDSSNAAGFVQIGRLIAGPVWQPQVGTAFGARVRVVDPAAVQRTRAGLRIAEDLPRWREMRLRFGFLTRDEAWGFVHDMMRAGKRAELWVELDLDEPNEAGRRRRMRCALTDTGDVIHDLPSRWSCDLLLEELI